jgi:hypothetical protein
MITFLRMLFGKMPKPGERFYFDQDGDPFKDSWEIVVTETRGKWVKYKYCSFNGENSMSRDCFYFCFRPKL